MKQVHGWPTCTSLRRLTFRKNAIKSVHLRVTSTRPIALNSNIQAICKQAYKQGTMKMVHGWPSCTSLSRPILDKNLLKSVHSWVASAHPIACNSNIQEIGNYAYKQGPMKRVQGWPRCTSLSRPILKNKYKNYAQLRKAIQDQT